MSSARCRRRHSRGSLAPEAPDEERRVREAEIRRAHRLAGKTEINQGREDGHGTTSG